MGYTRLRLRSIASAEEIARFLDDLERAAEIVEPASVESLVPRDSDDDPVIAGAIAGRADVLCTRDQHLYDTTVLEYCQTYAIEVLDDVTLLGRLRDDEAAGTADRP
ncbi:MAG: hypothetical protein KF708_11155 [Pirellulales bacterium]|nr:hypothetical protein [Pirellulales bacterium]